MKKENVDQKDISLSDIILTVDIFRGIAYKAILFEFANTLKYLHPHVSIENMVLRYETPSSKQQQAEDNQRLSGSDWGGLMLTGSVLDFVRLWGLVSPQNYPNLTSDFTTIHRRSKYETIPLSSNSNKEESKDNPRPTPLALIPTTLLEDGGNSILLGPSSYDSIKHNLSLDWVKDVSMLVDNTDYSLYPLYLNLDSVTGVGLCGIKELVSEERNLLEEINSDIVSVLGTNVGEIGKEGESEAGHNPVPYISELKLDFELIKLVDAYTEILYSLSTFNRVAISHTRQLSATLFTRLQNLVSTYPDINSTIEE